MAGSLIRIIVQLHRADIALQFEVGFVSLHLNCLIVTHDGSFTPFILSLNGRVLKLFIVDVITKTPHIHSKAL